MRVGLGARLALIFGVLAAVIAIVTAVVASASTNRQVRADVDQFLRDRASDIAEGRRQGPLTRTGRDDDRGQRGNDRNNDRNDDQVDSDEAAESVLRAVEADAIVQLLSVDGEWMGSSGLLLPISEADRSYSDRFAPALLRTEEIDGEDYRMITAHIPGGGAVQVAQSLTTTNLLLVEIRQELLLVGAGLSVLAALVGWGVASGMTRPLRRLTESVESIRATQDLSESVALARDDELGRLAESFDGLLQSLAESRDQQQRLVQDAAHELRTPLTSVRANIDFLERARDLEPDERSAALRSIKAELGELSNLLGEVVELATESRDQRAFEPVDLASVADAALAQFELRSGRPVERHMKTSVVMGDAAMLTRAVSNLIANADKYTPEPTSPVTVSVGDGMVKVADRGPGVAPDEQAQMFDRFWRADAARSASGSGLGLAIVKKAVDEHGGSVFVHDRHGGGLEVGFRLVEVDAG